ncbi:MAG: hypothetical protein WD018_03000 [Nitrosopumilaceae archaeon]
MVSLRLKLFAIFAISILLLAGTNSFFSSVHAQKLTKNQLKQCEYLYFNYKKFGEAEFLKRYDFKSFIRECVKLYKDPKWTFTGKDKVDQYFDKSINAKKSESANSKPKISITHKLKVGHTRFLAGFSACALASGVIPNFLLSSDKEQFLGLSTKMIPANTCRIFSAYLQTQNPTSISIEHIADPAEFSHLKVKRL